MKFNILCTIRKAISSIFKLWCFKTSNSCWTKVSAANLKRFAKVRRNILKLNSFANYLWKKQKQTTLANRKSYIMMSFSARTQCMLWHNINKKGRFYNFFQHTKPINTFLWHFQFRSFASKNVIQKITLFKKCYSKNYYSKNVIQKNYSKNKKRAMNLVDRFSYHPHINLFLILFYV